MDLIKTIDCSHCHAQWTVDSGPDGRGYTRAALVLAAPKIAAHMRTHGDESAALRYEKWAVTPPPWTNSTQK